MDLDIENLDALRVYLVAQGHVKPEEFVACQKLEGGVSSRTVKVLWPDGHGWVLKQALAKLRVKVDWFSDPERIKVEGQALRWLNRHAPPGMTPAFIFEDRALLLMAMEAIPDDHKNWKTLLLSGEVIDSHFEQFGLLLGTIQRQSSDPKSQVAEEFADTTHFESLRLDPYYLYTARMVPAAGDFLNKLATETRQHKHSLVHGDYSPKNALIYQGKLILLDHEVFHFGDPSFDLGFALTHFLSKANHLPQVRQRLGSAALLFWQTYFKEVADLDWGGDVESRAVRQTLGCMLARVAGKSPLEYLTPEEAIRQREVILGLVAAPPAKVSDLITEFVCKIHTYASH